MSQSLEGYCIHRALYTYSPGSPGYAKSSSLKLAAAVLGDELEPPARAMPTATVAKLKARYAGTGAHAFIGSL
jgi:hypothetical protein